jgi:hypothetical protein
VRNSVAAGTGIAALESGSGTITLMIDRAAAVNYVGGTGILASGAGTTIQIGDSTVTGNLLGCQPRPARYSALWQQQSGRQHQQRSTIDTK